MGTTHAHIPVAGGATLCGVGLCAGDDWPDRLVILRGFGALTALLRSRQSSGAQASAGGSNDGADASFVATRLPPLIAIGFGLAFVLINAPSLPHQWPAWARTGAIAVAAALAVWVLLRPAPPAPRPGRPARVVYWRGGGIEAAAIFVGARWLMWLDAKELGVIWVIAVVGVHFIPLARAFQRPPCRVLGVLLIALPGVGAGLTARWGGTGSGLAGVTAGAVLLVFAAAFGRARPRR